MRLTPLASNRTYFKLALLPAALAFAMAVRAGETSNLVLDLTAPTSKGEQVTSLVGMSVGGATGMARIPRLYPLALNVKLQLVSPQRFGPHEKLSVEMVLKNTGANPCYLPASPKHATVLKQGNKGRRTLLFSIVVEDVKRGRKLSFVIGSSDGSQTVPGSFLRIKPGQEVRVLLAGGLNSVGQQQTLLRWVGKGVKQVQARAKVTEWKYEDKRYFIENESRPVISANSIILDLTQ